MIQNRKKIIVLGLFLAGSLFLSSGWVSIQGAGTNEEVENPSVLFSTYLGGARDERHKNQWDLAVSNTCNDSQGNIIIVGRSTSFDYAVENALQSEIVYGSDMVITKIAGDGQTLIFSTYLGGSDDDWATDVCVDSNDDILIVGSSSSDDFPVSNAFQATNHGGGLANLDIVLVKISGATNEIIFSTYFGGTQDDWGYAIAVDSDDNFIITGSTYSSNLPLQNAHQTLNLGGVSAYISKFSSDGQGLIFSTLYGGRDNDWGVDLVCDSNDNIILTGGTMSSAFPTVEGIVNDFKGGIDGILLKIEPTGVVDFATMFGTSAIDRPYSVCVDRNDEIVVTGYTESHGWLAIYGAKNDMGNGAEDIFLAKFSNDGQSMPNLAFFGGSEDDGAYKVISDGENFYIVGSSEPTDDFPLVRNMAEFNENDELILLMVNNTLHLEFSTPFGGSSDEFGKSLCFVGENELFILGITKSIDFPMVLAYQDEKPGTIDFDMLAVKIYLDPDNLPPLKSSIPLPMEFIGISAGFGIYLIIYFEKRKKSISPKN
ncbi:MAG: SBBP repeat-containing protein [Promethearchaeota archaeon]